MVSPARDIDYQGTLVFITWYSDTDRQKSLSLSLSLVLLLATWWIFWPPETGTAMIIFCLYGGSRRRSTSTHPTADMAIFEWDSTQEQVPQPHPDDRHVTKKGASTCHVTSRRPSDPVQRPPSDGCSKAGDFPSVTTYSRGNRSG